MSWKALYWATESEVESAIAKFILLLLANKANENFSCYSSIRTLIAESGASRSTVLRALQKLETEGYVARNPQFHDSGAQRVNRYYLNHPLARTYPHPRPDARPPGLDAGRAPSQRGTPGVSERDPLNPTSKPPSEPCADAMPDGQPKASQSIVPEPSWRSLPRASARSTSGESARPTNINSRQPAVVRRMRGSAITHDHGHLVGRN
jgi:DNA-binding transcriptional MocR family regulator